MSSSPSELSAELILQPLRHFTYVTTHSSTLPSLFLRHSSFPNPSVASPTSQFILQPFFRFSYVTSSSLNSPGEPTMFYKKGRCSIANSWNRGCSFTRDEQVRQLPSLCFPHTTLSLASEQTLKIRKDPRGPSMEVRGVDWLTGSSGLHRNSPQGLNISSIRGFDQIRDPEIPITFVHPPPIYSRGLKFLTCYL